MNRNKILLVLGLAVSLCAAVIAVSDSKHEKRENRYELENEISLPEYKSNIDKMIDAYERMVDRLLYATSSGTKFNADVNSIYKKLSDIDNKLAVITGKLETIEKKLEIKQDEQLIKTADEINNIHSDSNGTTAPTD
jgi:septal ring factor EnvC (AmiA/AmiB activator)